MNLIDKIKMLFEATPIEASFLDAKLVDGTIVRVEGDSFKVGDAVKVITEAGETVQAPEGEHELEDGTVIVIDAEGNITEVRNIEAEMAEEAPVDAIEPTVEMVEESPIEEVVETVTETELADRVAALEEALAMLIDHMKTMMEKNQAEMTATKEALSKVTAEKELLEKAPAAKAVITKKFEKTEVVKSTSTNRIADLLANNTKK
jgi:hypothetical protein